MTTIVLATDQPAIESWLTKALRRTMADLRIVGLASSGALVMAAQGGGVDLVVMDIAAFDHGALPMIGVLDGEFRTPVVALTRARSGPEPAKLIEAGALDVVYLYAPPDEIRTRVTAALHRAESMYPPKVVRTGAIEFNLVTGELSVAGEPVHLTRTESAVLRLLAAHIGAPVVDEDALAAVWGPECIDAVEYLRVYVGYLRRKVDRALPAGVRSHIQRARGRGYRLLEIPVLADAFAA